MLGYHRLNSRLPATAAMAARPAPSPMCEAAPVVNGDGELDGGVGGVAMGDPEDAIEGKGAPLALDIGIEKLALAVGYGAYDDGE